MEIYKILYITSFIALLGVPFVFSYSIRKRFKGVYGFCMVVGLSSILMCSVVVVQWLVSDWYLESKIAPLDRDGDGFWSEGETATWTAEDHKNMEIHFGDGGRNVFVVIIFPFFSLLYSFISTLVYWLCAIFVSMRKHA